MLFLCFQSTRIHIKKYFTLPHANIIANNKRGGDVCLSRIGTQNTNITAHAVHLGGSKREDPSEKLSFILRSLIWRSCSLSSQKMTAMEKTSGDADHVVMKNCFLSQLFLVAFYSSLLQILNPAAMLLDSKKVKRQANWRKRYAREIFFLSFFYSQPVLPSLSLLWKRKPIKFTRKIRT